MSLGLLFRCVLPNKFAVTERVKVIAREEFCFSQVIFPFVCKSLSVAIILDGDMCGKLP